MANRDVGAENKAESKQVDPKIQKIEVLKQKLNTIIDYYQTQSFPKNKNFEALIVLQKEAITILEKKHSEQIKYYVKLKKLLGVIYQEQLQHTDEKSWTIRGHISRLTEVLHTLMLTIEVASRLDAAKPMLLMYGGNQNLTFQYVQLPLLARQLDKSYSHLPQKKQEVESKQIAFHEASFGNMSSLPDDPFRNVLSFLSYKESLNLRGTCRGGLVWHSHFLFRRSCETPLKFVPGNKCNLVQPDLGVDEIHLKRYQSTVLDDGTIAGVVFASGQSIFACCVWDNKTGKLIKKSENIDITDRIYECFNIAQNATQLCFTLSLMGGKKQFCWDINKNEMLSEVDPYNRELVKHSKQTITTIDGDIIYVNRNCDGHKYSIHLLQREKNYKGALLISDAVEECNISILENGKIRKIFFVSHDSQAFTVCTYDLRSQKEETFCTLLARPSNLVALSDDNILVEYDKHNVYRHQRKYSQFVWQCGKEEEIYQAEINKDKNCLAIATIQKNGAPSQVMNDTRSLKLYCIHLEMLKAQAATLESSVVYGYSGSRIEWTKEGVLYHVSNFSVSQWVIRQPVLEESKEQSEVSRMLARNRR